MAVVFLLFLIFLSPGCSKLNQQAIVSKAGAVDPYAWDFGRVKEGEVLKHNFTLKNESRQVLNIKDINTTCGCTVSKINKKVLLAQESALIGVQFDSRGYNGSVQQYIYVHTDRLDTPILRFIIKAEVVK